MRQKIEDACAEYDQKVYEYVTFLRELRRVYGKDFETRSIGGPDQAALFDWKTKLEFAEEILGLTKEEIKECRDRAEVRYLPFGL
jgi:hypothetical protein